MNIMLACRRPKTNDWDHKLIYWGNKPVEKSGHFLTGLETIVLFFAVSEVVTYWKLKTVQV